jgi:uncharacterized membrane protein YhaH (DUF805 family)
MQQPWFKAKTFGWGWTPATWQGWLILLVYIISIAVSAILFLRPKPTPSGWTCYISTIAIATAILIAVCIKTGEKPTWRWGKHKN